MNTVINTTHKPIDKIDELSDYVNQQSETNSILNPQTENLIFNEEEANQLVSYYRSSNLCESFSLLYRILREKINVSRITFHVKHIDSKWLFLIGEFEGDDFKEVGLIQLDSFLLTNDAIRKKSFEVPTYSNRINDDNKILFDVLGPNEHSYFTMPFLQKNTGTMFLICFSKEANAFNEEHINFVSQLIKPLQIIMEKEYHIPVSDLDSMIPSGNDCVTMLNMCSGMHSILHQVEKIAPIDSLVLIKGETGTGKGIVANALHTLSSRRKQAFIKVNCGALPESLLESELFGYEKGAFTGALKNHIGYFERAHNGTLFLDEIGELSFSAQVRLLHVLETGEVQRIGSDEVHHVNVRIIAASNKNLWDMVDEKKFREDLCYRLDVFFIAIPPLRERKKDIEILSWYYTHAKAKKMGYDTPPKLSSDCLDVLTQYSWPGNVRELIHTIERSMLSNKKILTGSDILFSTRKKVMSIQENIDKNHEDFQSFDDYIKDYLSKVLIHTQGKLKGKNGAAEILQVHPSTLRHKIIKLGLGEYLALHNL